MFLSDTQLSREDAFYKVRMVKERLGNDWHVAKTAKSPNKMVGGQVAIVRPWLALIITSVEADPTNLGMYLALKFRHGPRTLCIAGVYWPNAHMGPNSLKQEVANYMRTALRRGSITDFVRDSVSTLVHRVMVDLQNTCIIGGDWNSNWIDGPGSPRRSHSGLKPWAW